MYRLLCVLLMMAVAGGVLMGDPQESYDLLLDDFSDTAGVSAVGTRWEGFTDQVMGGVSQMQEIGRAHV